MQLEDSIFKGIERFFWLSQLVQIFKKKLILVDLLDFFLFIYMYNENIILYVKNRFLRYIYIYMFFEINVFLLFYVQLDKLGKF